MNALLALTYTLQDWIYRINPGKLIAVADLVKASLPGLVH